MFSIEPIERKSDVVSEANRFAIQDLNNPSAVVHSSKEKIQKKGAAGLHGRRLAGPTTLPWVFQSTPPSRTHHKCVFQQREGFGMY